MITTMRLRVLAIGTLLLGATVDAYTPVAGLHAVQ